MKLKQVKWKYGQFIANEDDSYVGKSIIEYGQYAQQEIDLLANIINKETIICDVGANFGAMTIPFARMAKKVVAFECQPQIFNGLCANVFINELTNVETHRCAIGEKLGTAYWQSLEDFEFNNGSHCLQTEGDPQFQVNVIPLTVPCHLLKVDVEGFELQVLRGATPMVNKYKPIIFVENDRAHNSKALISYIQNDLQYKAFWCPFMLFDPKNYNNQKTNIWGGDVGCFNMICFSNTEDVDLTTIGLKLVEPNDTHELFLGDE